MRDTRRLLAGLLPALGLILACLGSCSATVAAPPRLDGIAKALAPPPGHALLYVIRPEFMGQAMRFDVLVNGTWIGATGGFRYVFTYLKPGHYLIQSRAENIAELRLSVQAGGVYFVEQRPLMGMFGPQNTLDLLPEELGRRRIRPCALSAAMPREVLAYAMSLGSGGPGSASPGAAPAAAPGAGGEPGGGRPGSAPPGAKQGSVPPRAGPRDAAPPASTPPAQTESF